MRDRAGSGAAVVMLDSGLSRHFREQVPGVLERYQRRTSRLTRQVQTVVCELASKASVRLSTALRVPLSRHTAIRVLLGNPAATAARAARAERG